LLAISLDHPILDESKWKAVVEVCREKLLTPVGLRSLSPDHKDCRSDIGLYSRPSTKCFMMHRWSSVVVRLSLGLFNTLKVFNDKLSRRLDDRTCNSAFYGPSDNWNEG